MINLFNLFLFLLAFWGALMVIFSQYSIVYLLIGIFASFFISIISFRLKIVTKNSELLYMSFGFYKHFFLLYCSSFFKSLGLIFKLSYNPNMLEPVIYNLEIPAKYKFNLSLLISSINLAPGLLTIGTKNEGKILLIHACDKKYLQNFDIENICSNLDSVNDDNLV